MGGDAEVGGGGSVQWDINADNVKDDETINDPPSGPPITPSKTRHQHGRDLDGAEGTDFTVSIQVPKSWTSGKAFLDHLKSILALTDGDRRVYFNHPIEKNEKQQIRVSWGETNRNHRGNGGKKA